MLASVQHWVGNGSTSVSGRVRCGFTVSHRVVHIRDNVCVLVSQLPTSYFVFTFLYIINETLQYISFPSNRN